MRDIDYIPNLHRNGVTLFIYYSMRAFVILAASVFLLEGDFSSAGGCLLVFLVMMAPSVLKERYRLYLPFTLDLLIVTFVFGTLFLGHVLQFYEQIPLWDKFLHFQSGLILSVTGFVLVYILNEHRSTPLDLSPGFIALFAIVFSVAIGGIWEMAEYFGDQFFGTTWAPSQADTMWDLLADTVGAVLVNILGYFWMHSQKRLPFTPLKFRELKKRLLGIGK